MQGVKRCAGKMQNFQFPNGFSPSDIEIRHSFPDGFQFPNGFSRNIAKKQEGDEEITFTFNSLTDSHLTLI